MSRSSESQRGSGALSPEREAEARALYEAGGLSMKAIGDRVGVSKNTIIGLAHRHWKQQLDALRSGLLDRMDALDRNLAAVLRQYPPGYGRVPVPPPGEKKPRSRGWAHR